MKELALAVVLMVVSSGAVMAGDDRLERQHEQNKNRRSRQAEVIENAPNDKKADAARKAHDRNQDVRGRQKDVNREIDRH